MNIYIYARQRTFLVSASTNKELESYHCYSYRQIKDWQTKKSTIYLAPIREPRLRGQIAKPNPGERGRCVDTVEVYLTWGEAIAAMK